MARMPWQAGDSLHGLIRSSNQQHHFTVRNKRTGEVLQGNVTILGSARIDGFNFYKLEWATASNPDSWRAVSTTRPEPVINGLVNKGKCYSALIQMLGTRTVSERLRQLLVILAETYGRPEQGCTVIDRTITYDQIATIVGATRQWVTQSLDRLQSEGVLQISRKKISISDLDQLFE